MDTIEIRTFGEFSLRVGDTVISDAGNRSRKVWALLAYLICHRGKPVPQQNLIQLFWAEENASNPENAFRITLHRIRTQLDKLFPDAGRICVLHQGGGYCWNEDVPVQFDCDRFDQLYLSGTQEPEQRLEELLEAISLYRGEFLPKQASEV